MLPVRAGERPLGDPLVLQNASEQAADVIRLAILEGRLAPGQRIKAEVVAMQLNLSRTPVREALMLLQREGLIDSTPNRGAVVRSFDAAELGQTYSIRALLEAYGAELATTRLTALQLSELELSCVRFRALRVAGAFTELVKENRHFHDLILVASGMSRLKEMVTQLVQMPLIYQGFLWYSADQRVAAEDHHRRLLAAFESRDQELAAATMREHILESRDQLLSLLEQRDILAATAALTETAGVR